MISTDQKRKFHNGKKHRTRGNKLIAQTGEQIRTEMKILNKMEKNHGPFNGDGK